MYNVHKCISYMYIFLLATVRVSGYVCVGGGGEDADPPDVRGKGVPNTDVKIVLIVKFPLMSKSVQIKLLALLGSLHLEAQLLSKGGLIPGVGDGLPRVDHNARLGGSRLVVVHRHLREVLESKR